MPGGINYRQVSTLLGLHLCHILGDLFLQKQVVVDGVHLLVQLASAMEAQAVVLGHHQMVLLWNVLLGRRVREVGDTGSVENVLLVELDGDRYAIDVIDEADPAVGGGDGWLVGRWREDRLVCETVDLLGLRFVYLAGV